ncbi:hypothetical protein DM01DRAFT_1330974 [Hesseltinella vesiculosa]|uniref:Uncharacterized protein n=1 Tax=Hesseltinella vesiculosa TaxID=101127 RepID=A0A1X2GXN7_9FUNG|nr:hypothetical protein DM01DRAFT_1330974 [Hesseltinella vesiculosa]
MNAFNVQEARNLYKEYKHACWKIGIPDANAQYLPNQSNQLFVLLAEACHIYYTIKDAGAQAEQPDAALRKTVHLWTNEAFVMSHGTAVVECLDEFEQLEQQLPNPEPIVYSLIFQGFVYLRTRNAIVEQLVDARPLDFDTYIDCILDCLPSLSSVSQIHASDMIYTMVTKQPTEAARVRYELTRRRILPNLVTRLTVTYCQDDYVEFLTGIFSTDHNWFLAQPSTSLPMLRSIKAELFDQMNQNKGNIPRQTVLLRAIIGLICFFGIRLTETECKLCLDLLKDPPSKCILELGLCLLVVSSEQMVKLANIKSTLSELMKRPESDLALLLMSYFQVNKIPQVEQTIRSILKMPLPIAKIGLYELQNVLKAGAAR